jgi:hypothetical protein
MHGRLHIAAAVTLIWAGGLIECIVLTMMMVMMGQNDFGD